MALNYSDPGARRRWILAFAFALALNEIAIGLLHGPAVQPDKTAPAMHVAIERMPTPRPTPKPTPPPILHVPPHATPAPVQQIAAAKAVGPKAPKHGGSIARHVAKPKEVAHLLVRSGTGEAKGVTGAGTGEGAGPGEGGGDNGTTAGTGAGGNGTGAVNANTPCGEVMFNVVGPPKNPDHNTQIERVSATVSFPDDHTERVVIPYPWPYTNPEQNDPWSSTQLRLHPNDPVRMVLPPPGTDTNSFEPLLKYILTHTTSDGLTTLASCPKK